MRAPGHWQAWAAVAAGLLALVAPAATAEGRARLTTLTVAVRLDTGAAIRGAGEVVIAGPHRKTCLARCHVRVRAGARRTLIARDRAGYEFDHWADASLCAQRDPQDRRCTVRPRRGLTAVATFRARTFRLDVVASGGGTLTSGGNGIECGGGASACSADFAPGTRITLKATPPPDGHLVGWSIWQCPGATPVCRFKMDTDRTVVALMDPVRLTVQRLGDGGLITSDPAGIACGDGCDSQTVALPRDTRVTVTASDSASGAAFRRWSDPCAGSLPSCTFRLLDDETVIGTFGDVAPPAPGPVTSLAPHASQQFRVILRVRGRGFVTAPGPGGGANVIRCRGRCTAGGFGRNALIALTAHPGRGRRVRHWYKGCGGHKLRCRLPVFAYNDIRVVFGR